MQDWKPFSRAKVPPMYWVRSNGSAWSVVACPDPTLYISRNITSESGYTLLSADTVLRLMLAGYPSKDISTS